MRYVKTKRGQPRKMSPKEKTAHGIGEVLPSFWARLISELPRDPSRAGSSPLQDLYRL